MATFIGFNTTQGKGGGKKPQINQRIRRREGGGEWERTGALFCNITHSTQTLHTPMCAQTKSSHTHTTQHNNNNNHTKNNSKRGFIILSGSMNINRQPISNVCVCVISMCFFCRLWFRFLLLLLLLFVHFVCVWVCVFFFFFQKGCRRSRWTSVRRDHNVYFNVTVSDCLWPGGQINDGVRVQETQR